MVKPSERRKKKKHFRTPGGKPRTERFKKSPSKRQCALCERVLAGTLPRKKEAKASLSENKPSAPFAGQLCSVCRGIVFEEAFKVKEGVKKKEGVELRLESYVDAALRKIEG